MTTQIFWRDHDTFGEIPYAARIATNIRVKYPTWYATLKQDASLTDSMYLCVAARRHIEAQISNRSIAAILDQLSLEPETSHCRYSFTCALPIQQWEEELTQTARSLQPEDLKAILHSRARDYIEVERERKHKEFLEFQQIREEAQAGNTKRQPGA